MLGLWIIASCLILLVAVKGGRTDERKITIKDICVLIVFSGFIGIIPAALFSSCSDNRSNSSPTVERELPDYSRR